jgi:outer membrane lipopolysaccharide assembly protein LptE/RlpB
MRRLGISTLAALTVFLAGCGALDALSAVRSASDAAQAAGDIARDTVDAYSLGRAEQIRLRANAAATSAQSGDSAAALKALSEAQAEVTLSILRELAEARAMCSEPASVPAAVTP